MRWVGGAAIVYGLLFTVAAAATDFNPYAKCSEALLPRSLGQLWETHAREVREGLFSGLEVRLHEGVFASWEPGRRQIETFFGPNRFPLPRLTRADLLALEIRRSQLAPRTETERLASEALRQLIQIALRESHPTDPSPVHTQIWLVVRGLFPEMTVKKGGLGFARRFAIHQARWELGRLTENRRALEDLDNKLYVAKVPLTQVELQWLVERMEDLTSHWRLPGDERLFLASHFFNVAQAALSADTPFLPGEVLSQFLREELPDFYLLDSEATARAEDLDRALRTVQQEGEQFTYRELLLRPRGGFPLTLPPTPARVVSALVEYYTRAYLTGHLTPGHERVMGSMRDLILGKIAEGEDLESDEAAFIVDRIPSLRDSTVSQRFRRSGGDEGPTNLRRTRL